MTAHKKMRQQKKLGQTRANPTLQQPPIAEAPEAGQRQWSKPPGLPWLVLLLWALLGSAIIWVGDIFDLWWLTTVIGLLTGLFILPAGRALLLATIVGGLGWGLPLLWQALTLPVGTTADVISGIVGFGAHNGAIVWILTILLGIVLGVSGAWVAITLRRLVIFSAPTRPERHRGAASEKSP